jgi:hypothetical protein
MDTHTRPISREPRWLDAAAGMLLAALSAAVLLGRPGHAAWLPPCPLHALTGFFCPGCGSTRALYYLLHGHLFAALGENALAVILFPFVVYELIALLTRRLPSLSARLRPSSLWTLLTVVILFAVLRNIPVFHLLAPTDIP